MPINGWTDKWIWYILPLENIPQQWTQMSHNYTQQYTWHFTDTAEGKKSDSKQYLQYDCT